MRDLTDAGVELIWPRENFNNIGYALTTIFLVIIGEDWQAVMYMYSKVVQEDGSSMYNTSTIFFVCVMSIGNFILLALFTAILLQKFEEEYQDQLLKKEIKHKEKLRKQESLGSALTASAKGKPKCCSLEGVKFRCQKVNRVFQDMFGGRFDHGILKKEINKKPGNVKNAAGPASGDGSIHEICDPSKKLGVQITPLKLPNSTKNQITPTTQDKFIIIRSDFQGDDKSPALDGS